MRSTVDRILKGTCQRVASERVQVSPSVFIMAAFTGSPPPRRKNQPPSRQAAISPPPRRAGRLVGSKPASRLPTPARNVDQSHFKDDVTVGSMDVDEDALQPTERGLRQDTIFAKSEEMSVTFYGHLPAEVKHVLRNAGELARCFPTRLWKLLTTLCCRLLPRRVCWRC